MLLKGMVIGLAIAAPVGPIGLLCLPLPLTSGRWSVSVATPKASRSSRIVESDACIVAPPLRMVAGLTVLDEWLRHG